MDAIYPKKFDSAKLSADQINILAALFRRRQVFDLYLKENNIRMFTCPGCGYPTLHERGAYEICSLCDWEDDDQDDERADEIWGGPNAGISLTENRLAIGAELNEMAIKAGKKLSEHPDQVFRTLNEHFNPNNLLEQ